MYEVFVIPWLRKCVYAVVSVSVEDRGVHVCVRVCVHVRLPLYSTSIENY